MNWWVYLGYSAICLIGFLLFLLVYIGILIYVDSYYADKEIKDKATCAGCKHIAYDSGGAAHCTKNVSAETLDYFNERNIRPCKMEETMDIKKEEKE